MKTIVFEKPKRGINGIDWQFYRIKWLAKIASKEETRYNLSVIYVDNDLVGTATDGHRLHAADVDGLLEPGYYGVRSVKSNMVILDQYETGEEPGRFPDWVQVFPRLSGQTRVFLPDKHDYAQGDVGPSVALARIVRRMSGGLALKYQYLVDLLSDEANDGWTAYVDNGDGPVMFSNQDVSCIAAIMPCKA